MSVAGLALQGEHAPWLLVTCGVWWWGRVVVGCVRRCLAVRSNGRLSDDQYAKRGSSAQQRCDFMHLVRFRVGRAMRHQRPGCSSSMHRVTGHGLSPRAELCGNVMYAVWELVRCGACYIENMMLAANAFASFDCACCPLDPLHGPRTC